MNPEQEASLLEQGGKLAGEIVRALVNRPEKKRSKPVDFPEQRAALLTLGDYTDPRVLDNDDVMVKVGARQFLVTAAGNVFEQLPSRSGGGAKTPESALDSGSHPSPRLGQIVERKNLDHTTFDYQEQLLYSELWLAETHAKEDFHGCSTDVHCGFKHGLNLVALATETKSMTSDPMWQRIDDMGNELMQKAHPSRVEQGHFESREGRDIWISDHHEEYSVLAIRIGEIRKEMGNRVIGRRKPAVIASGAKQPAGDITLEEAKKLAADEAAREVEKQWRSH